MNSQVTYKVPNGKLLKIFLTYNDKNKVIEEISITGDFFAYPEESIFNLEKTLVNTEISKEILFNKIRLFVDKNNVEFIGLNEEELTKGIMMCLK